MNYVAIYQSLIARGLSRKLDSFGEVHHILPKCLGGTDDKINLVKLTPEEHYVAHQLLVKIYPKEPKLVKAATMMIPNRPSNKMYGWLRRRLAEIQSVDQAGINNSQYGTAWITNGLVEKKIKVAEDVPLGWSIGRKTKPKKIKVSIKEQKKLLDIAMYREYYTLYKQVGWSRFVELTQYKHTKPNFVARCAFLLEEFVPQNGKKRGK